MRTVAFSQVMWELLRERKFQDSKWGPIEAAPHTLGEWIIIAEFELAEAKLALIKGGAGRDSIRAELIQTAAVLVAALEQHGTMSPNDKREV